MSRVCQLTGKRPMTGHNVSHSNRKTKRRFLPNLQTHRFWSEEEQCFVKLRVTARAMRTIAKIGLKKALEKMQSRGGI